MKVTVILCTLFCFGINLSQAVPASLRAGPSYKRIFNGNNAKENEWPWHVSIVHNLYNGVICSGSIISEEWVLTSAICGYFYAASSLLVTVGEHNTSTTSINEKKHKVENIIIYNSGNQIDFESDVALLHLKTPIVFNDKVRAIQLPLQGDRVPAGTKCFATGWGKTTYYHTTSLKDAMAKTLQEADLTIVDDDSCIAKNQWFDKAALICAGGKGKGVCKGDEGGPLSCFENGEWVLRGVTGLIWHTCESDDYSYFARVSSFTDWVKKTAVNQANVNM